MTVQFSLKNEKSILWLYLYLASFQYVFYRMTKLVYMKTSLTKSLVILLNAAYKHKK